MGFIFETRESDSPYLETVTRGRTVGEGSTIRPAESHWHMVFVQHEGNLHPIVTGPLPTAGAVSWTEGAEILWVKFKLGTFMPHLPFKQIFDGETILPGASRQSFWLRGSAWEFPDFENVETLVNRLAREETLVRDPLVNEVMQGHPHELSARTVRHRILQATGMSQNQIHQIQRAQAAAALLAQGSSILDTMDALGFYDQPHLTRALKQWVGHTPAQISKGEAFADARSTTEK